jgi:hypothetical protein
MTDQVSNPYGTIGNMIVSCILIFMVLDMKPEKPKILDQILAHIHIVQSALRLLCGPAVTHRMYCSLPRLIVLTPLLVFPFYLQARCTSDDTRDLYQRKVERLAMYV